MQTLEEVAMKPNTIDSEPISIHDEITFLNSAGHESVLSIQEAELIGYGDYGEIFYVVGDLTRMFKDSVKNICSGSFVIKRFYSEDLADKAHQNYQALKKGHRTPKLYRKSKDKRDILMKNLNEGRRKAVSHNNESLTLDYFRKNPIESIIDFSDFVESFFRKACIPAMVGKQIISDTYFFIVEENGNSEVTLDAVAYDLDTYAQGYSVQVNLDSAKEAVSNFIRRCVQADKQEGYLRIIDDTYRRISDEFDYRASKVLDC